MEACADLRGPRANPRRRWTFPTQPSSLLLLDVARVERKKSLCFLASFATACSRAPAGWRMRMCHRMVHQHMRRIHA